MALKINSSNSVLRIFPHPGQPLFSARFVQRKYPGLFGGWAFFDSSANTV